MKSVRAISAIIVLYHSKHLVEKIVDNIISKITGLNEIILIDNSNEDLSEFDNNLVKVIHSQKNIGYGAAINLGVRAAKNNIIVALNPDIEITNWELPAELTEESLMLISGKPHEWSSIRKFPTLTYDILRLSLKNLSRPFRMVEKISGNLCLENLIQPAKVDWISGSLIITSKRTMFELGGFDEKYFLFYEELDLCKRAMKKNIPCYIFPCIQFYLNQGNSSANDVSFIKINSEINSAQIYHTKYSGKISTRITFVIFKIYCYFIWRLMWIISVFIHHHKLENKIKQFRIYSDVA